MDFGIADFDVVVLAFFVAVAGDGPIAISYDVAVAKLGVAFPPPPPAVNSKSLQRTRRRL